MQLEHLQRLRDLRIFLQRRKDKKIIIFGAGDYGRRTHFALAAIGFPKSYFVDNYVTVGNLFGRLVRPFSDLLVENREKCLCWLELRNITTK